MNEKIGVGWFNNLRLRFDVIVYRILPAVPVVPKSFSYEWKKYPPSSKIGVGLPTTTKKTKEESSMKLDTDSLAHSKWNCKYHIVFAMVF